MRNTIGMAALGLLAICGLTDASTKVPEASPKPFPGWEFDWKSEWYAPHSGWCLDRNGVPREGATIVRQYNVAQAVKRFADDAGNVDSGRRLLQLMLLGQVQGSTGRNNSLPLDWARERVKFEGDTVTIDAPNDVQEQLAWEIAAWERSGCDSQICMRLTFIGDGTNLDAVKDVKWRTLDAFSVAKDGSVISETNSGSPMIRTKSPSDSNLPIRVATLNGTQVEQLMHQPGPKAPGPCVTTFDGQRFQLFAGVQRPFVTGIALNADNSRKPKVALVSDGFQIRCRSTVFDEADRPNLEATLEVTKIFDVQVASTLIHGEQVKIQVPSVKHWRMDLSANLQNDESLLIGCIPQFDKEQFCYLLLTKRIITQEMLATVTE